jgi:hypothetical protein
MAAMPPLASMKIAMNVAQAPPVYAIVARDQHAFHFRCVEPPVANSDK